LQRWLRFYTFVICYRFRGLLQPLSLPKGLEALPVQTVQKKAAGSLTSAGVFFTLSVVLVAALLGELGAKIKDLLVPLARSPVSFQLLFLGMTMTSVVLPYLVIRQERSITNARVDAGPECEIHVRKCRYTLLWVWLLFSILFYGPVPWIWPATRGLFCQFLATAAFLLIAVSVFFLLFSVEFYDSASSWRGDDCPIHFHLATIAATSYLFGISLALVGAAMLICLLSVRIAGVAVVVTLLMLTAMTEIQRNLWHLRGRNTDSDRIPL